MRTAEVAQAMGMPVSSYEHFEAGKGRITFERLARFAETWLEQKSSNPRGIMADRKSAKGARS
jgi:transcriptional regulator with XRE-family HTH domain